MSITFHNKLLGLTPDAYYGGKSGGASYQGPTAYELDMQKQGYRQQWEQEAKLEEQQAILDEEKADAEKAQTELESRKGIKDILANQQRGFTKKDDEDDEGLLGVV